MFAKIVLNEILAKGYILVRLGQVERGYQRPNVGQNWSKYNLVNGYILVRLGQEDSEYQSPNVGQSSSKYKFGQRLYFG